MHPSTPALPVEGIRNDLPLSSSYVSVAEGGTQSSVQPSSDPGRSEYVREKEGREGKELESETGLLGS